MYAGVTGLCEPPPYNRFNRRYPSMQGGKSCSPSGDEETSCCKPQGIYPLKAVRWAAPKGRMGGSQRCGREPLRGSLLNFTRGAGRGV